MTSDPVSPTPSSSPEEPARSIAPQSEDLPGLAQEISDLGAARGFATARLNYADNSMDVLWQGEVPQDIVDVAQKNPAGVEVRFRTDAKYSRSQINRGVQKISVPEWPPGTVGITPADDYSGIVLEIEGDLPPSTEAVRDLERRSGLDIVEVKLNQPPPLWPTDTP